MMHNDGLTAEATEVKISLHLLAGKTLRSRNSVRLYQIVDNGNPLRPTISSTPTSAFPKKSKPFLGRKWGFFSRDLAEKSSSDIEASCRQSSHFQLLQMS